MTVSIALRLLAVMVLWAACFPLITTGLELAPHLAFAAMRALLAGVVLIALGVLFHGAIPLALLSMLTEDVSSIAWSAEFVLVLVILSIFETSLAFWLWFKVLERVELNRANAFTFLVPIFGLVIGAALFEERLGWLQAVGVLLILVGIVMVQSDARRASLAG